MLCITSSKMKTAFIFFSAFQFTLFWNCDLIHGEQTVESADYITEWKFECHYKNGTEKVRYLARVFYNGEEFVYFDSDKGYFIPKTEFGRPDAEFWNKNKELIEQRKAEVQTLCVHNYEIYEKMGITGRRVKPKIKVSLMSRKEDSHSDQYMLVCNVHDFYPSKIIVKWYRNDEEQTTQVESTDTFQNGDWTFQRLVMLETEIEKGDTFSCAVLHSSLDAPYRVDWQPQISDSARNKIATGIVGFVLGSVLIIAGVIVYMRGRKVQMSFRGPQTEHFIHS